MDGRTGGRNSAKQLLSQSARHHLPCIDVNFHQGRSLALVVHAWRDRYYFSKILAILNPIQMDAQICELAVVEMAILQEGIHGANHFLCAGTGLLSLEMIQLQDHCSLTVANGLRTVLERAREREPFLSAAYTAAACFVSTDFTA